MAALQIQGLKKAFGGLPAINDVSLKVEEGERRLIIGPNGAGKTTLFNLVTGDLRGDSGRIFLFEQEITRKATHRRVHLGLARTYQIITLFPRDTLEHNIALALLGLAKARWDVFRGFSKHFYDDAKDVLARVGLDHLARRPISELAYGEKRRLEVGLALAASPSLLLLDEPLAGMSPRERVETVKLLKSISKGRTMIIIDHDMDALFELAERVTVLQEGRVLVEGTPEEIKNNAIVQEAYLGGVHGVLAA